MPSANTLLFPLDNAPVSSIQSYCSLVESLRMIQLFDIPHYRQTDILCIITSRRLSFCTCYIHNVVEVPVQNQKMLDIPHICEIQ